jgi:hypothetical protein
MDDQRPADKRRVRFSIRDLLWFALVVALATGWWTDYQSRRYAISTNEYYSNLYALKYDEKVRTLDSRLLALDAENKKLARLLAGYYAHEK